MSPLTTAADKSQWLPLPSSRDVGAKISGVGVRRSEGDKKWSEEAGEWGRRRQGNGEGGGRGNGEGRRRHGLLLPSFFILYFEQGQHLLPHFFAFRTGAAFTAPMSFHFVLNGGSACCPRVFSFLFKRGQHLLPLSFLFISNGGSKCCPHFFSFLFEQGQQVLPPCLFFSF